MKKEGVTLSTVHDAIVFVTTAIGAKKDRNVMIIYIIGAFLHPWQIRKLTGFCESP